MICNCVVRVKHSPRRYSASKWFTLQAAHRSPANIRSISSLGHVGALGMLETLPPPIPDSPMTPAQIARAAAKAVHAAVSNHSLSDAYFIVNSLRYSDVVTKNPGLRKLDGIRSWESFEGVAIDFGQSVPIRQASHALLHDLIRLGLSKKAFRFSSMMMQRGVPIRTKTLEIIVGSIQSGTKMTASEVIPFVKEVLDNTLTLAGFQKSKKSRLRLTDSSYAGQLVDVAQRRRYRRACRLLYLLVFSLLVEHQIGLAVSVYAKILQSTPPLLGDSHESESTPITPPAQCTPVTSTPKSGWFEHRSPITGILSSIDTILSKDASIESPLQQEATQALARLASLLDLRQIPFGYIARLIRSLYNFPELGTKVIVKDGRRRTEVVAYTYFNQVLDRLIQSLHSESSSSRHSALPPLCQHSYNSLIYYALHHQWSFSSANIIISHMMHKRSPSLMPNATTLDIILRAGTLLRRSDIVDKVIALYREAESTQESKPITVLTELHSPSPSVAPSKKRNPNFKKLSVGNIILPPAVALGDIKASSRTIVAIVSHFVATGQPYRIRRAVFLLIPELNLGRKKTRHFWKAVERAAALGPHIVTALLNGLVKGGYTGLAERLWRVISCAEELSQTTNHPWTLPIAAHDIMVRCYGNEAKKHMDKLIRVEGPEIWRKEVRDNVLTKGWYGPETRTVEWKRKRRYGRGKRAAFAVYRTFMHRSLSSSVDVKADGRFFNSILRVITKPLTTMRGRRQSQSRSLRQDRFKRRLQMEARIPPRHWSSLLKVVGRDMATEGIPVPLGVKTLLRGNSRFLDIVRAQPSMRPGIVFRSHSVPVEKTRGLPGRRIV